MGDDTFCIGFGQDKWLIKHDDNHGNQRRRKARFAPHAGFVKMLRTTPAGIRDGLTPERTQRFRQFRKPFARRATITKSSARTGLTTRWIPLATRKELSDFLASVERRAYKQALFAARDEQVALDAVQDAMMKLAEKYSARPSTELPMLFQRILQNTIRDHFRRQKVRSLWTTPVSSLAGGEEGDDHDPLETLQVQSDSNSQEAPSDRMQQAQILEIIEEAMQKLPARQRQAFVLRYWEEMDVAAAAAVMGCSEGSVKTHCSRAAHALALLLKDKGISL